MKTNKPSLKHQFNTASVSPKHMRVIAEQHDPFSGARLVCAEIPAFYAGQAGLKSGPVFLVGWIPPWRGCVVQGRAAQTLSTAMKYFNAEKKTGRPPAHDDFQRDWQRSRTYRWEEANTDRNSLKLDFNLMAMVTGSVTRDFGLPPVLLHYVEPRPGADSYSYYFHADHRIEMRDKRYSALLHELAHAIDYRLNGNTSTVYHGPSFLRTLLCVAQLYRGFDIPAMETTLAAAGLKIAPLDDLPALKARMARLKNSNVYQLKHP